jgi:hypothetical protein
MIHHSVTYLQIFNNLSVQRIGIYIPVTRSGLPQVNATITIECADRIKLMHANVYQIK